MLCLKDEPLDIKVADVHPSSFFYCDDTIIRQMKISWNSRVVVACHRNPSLGLLPDRLGKSIDGKLGFSASPLFVLVY